MVKLWCSAFRRIRVPARPARHVHRRVPDVRRRTRRSASTIGGGYTGHDHQASCRGSHGSASLPAPATERLRSCYFLGLHTLRNNSLPVSPFLERFLDRSDHLITGPASPRFFSGSRLVSRLRPH